nr:putative zinc finger, BED-type [Tanacetum cinerariifolium]
MLEDNGKKIPRAKECLKIAMLANGYIYNFVGLVNLMSSNSPKGSVFVKSINVSDISKNATFLYEILDNMVEEVGEENVVQIITDNASAYVKA